ncbi:uncharacterized WD repeat-containing protein alr3466-like [Hydractinia symbiolongicarpus]|uniref:uncharacterized WD repeat-containing protein alr3466-like n=1 Tax=Hydractinia symbiolongicarpus TaxID=13093 RepID=UPI00254EDCE1|nr:uncharacterized WD repeat-containing protein alr3466-like [Hydractinia symbiolongicarpus]
MHTAREEKPGVYKKRSSLVDGKHHVVLEGNMKFINSMDFPAEVMCCRYDNQGKLLALGLSNGIIKIYSTESKSIVYSLHSTDENLPVTCVRWKPDSAIQSYGNFLLAVYASGTVRQWHVSTSKCVHSHTENVQMMACAFNNSGSNFVVGRSDGRINLYDTDTSTVVMVMEPSMNSEIMDGHVMRVFAVQFNPEDKNVFVSGGWDDTIQWWDSREKGGYSIKKITGPHICGEGLDIQHGTLNMLAASWRKQNNLQVFDFGTGKLIKEIPSDYNKSMLYCAQWLGRESIVAGGSHANSMRYIDINSLQTIGSALNLPGACYSLDHKTTHHPHVAVCASKTLYIVQDTM